MENNKTNDEESVDDIFNDVISRDIDFFLTSNKINFIKKILSGEFIMYEFT